jgi:hypothetical protein
MASKFNVEEELTKLEDMEWAKYWFQGNKVIHFEIVCFSHPWQSWAQVQEIRRSLCPKRHSTGYKCPF